MRTLIAGFALVCAGLLFTSNTNLAEEKKSEKKETVLTGKITCNKCDLGKSTKCETVIVVKDEKKKDIVYFFDKDSHAKFHDDICSAAKNGTVTGFVKDADKKKVISVKKVTYD